MLFGFNRKKKQQQNQNFKKVIIIQEGGKPKVNLKKLALLCPQRNQHQLPVRMVFLAMTRSRRGEPMAIYRCGCSNCTWREGYVLDHGNPKKLWGAPHNGQ